MARSRRSGLRFMPSLQAHDFALCRWCAGLWFRRRAHASHLAVISAVDLANGQGRGLDLVHRLESGSIANNLQQSWRFGWEPPKAVLRDVRTIDWIFGLLKSSA